MAESNAPLVDELKERGIVPVGALRWRLAKSDTPRLVLEQLLYEHGTGEQKWTEVPILVEGA